MGSLPTSGACSRRPCSLSLVLKPVSPSLYHDLDLMAGVQAHSLGAEVVQLAGSRSQGAAAPSLKLRMGSRVPLDGEELQVRCPRS